MAAFDFALEGVLRHRANIERQRQRDVAAIQMQMRRLESELRELDQTARQATADLRERGLVGRLDMGLLAAHRRFIASVQRRGMVLAQRMALLQRQLEAARLALAEAAKQRKIIEKLKERKYAAWLAELSRKEAAQMDEMGVQLSHHSLAEQRTAAVDRS